MLAASSIIIVLVGLGLFLGRGTGVAFDSAAWKDGTGIETGVRQKMADRLVAAGTLLGKTPDELTELLGPLEQRPRFGGWDLHIRLGLERGFVRIDDEWLVLMLGPDRRIVKAGIVTD